jgi:hypothetical protein
VGVADIGTYVRSGRLGDLGDTLMGESKKLGDIPITDPGVGQLFDRLIPPMTVSFGAGHCGLGLLQGCGETLQPYVPFHFEFFGF